jgi:hypothetical protein
MKGLTNCVKPSARQLLKLHRKMPIKRTALNIPSILLHILDTFPQERFIAAEDIEATCTINSKRS